MLFRTGSIIRFGWSMSEIYTLRRSMFLIIRKKKRKDSEGWVIVEITKISS